MLTPEARENLSIDCPFFIVAKDMSGRGSYRALLYRLDASLDIKAVVVRLGMGLGEAEALVASLAGDWLPEEAAVDESYVVT